VRFRKRPGSPPRVEMIPLIDTIFLLLVVFVTAMMSMTVDRGIKVDLPGAATAERSGREDHFSVTLTESGALYAGLEAVTVGELTDRIAAARKKDGDIKVFLRAHRNVPHGRVVEVLDAIRAGGVTAVSIEAQKKAGLSIPAVQGR